MRNSDTTSSRPSVRVLRGLALVAGVVTVMLTGAGTAAAAPAEANAMTFGLLGPVGLVAVVLGVLGMAAGVFRQRRKNRVQAVAAPLETEVSVPAGTQVD